MKYDEAIMIPTVHAWEGAAGQGGALCLRDSAALSVFPLKPSTKTGLWHFISSLAMAHYNPLLVEFRKIP